MRIEPVHVISVRNVGWALPYGMDLLRTVGVKRSSRNGQVIASTEPVTTRYERPTERVIFWGERDANPTFHLMESLWMLAGRKDLPFLTKYVKRMSQFSDDHGKTQPGAYGFRWRSHFGKDQVSWAVKRLADNADDRRVVIQMYDPFIDQRAADENGKDVPCNVSLHLQVAADGKLDMTVFCRSNDMVWGAYGANAVHFSMLQEYVASSIQREVGRYWQVSDNFHAYEDAFRQVEELNGSYAPDEPYTRGEVKPYPIMSTPPKIWEDDLKLYMEHGPIVGLRDGFFRRVVTPVDMAHKAYRENRGEDKFKIPLEIIQQCKAEDWKRACEEWYLRRQAAWERARDDGVSHEVAG